MHGQLSVLTSWVNKANLQENDVIRDEFAMVEGLAAEYYEVKETMTTNGRKKKTVRKIEPHQADDSRIRMTVGPNINPLAWTSSTRNILERIQMKIDRNRKESQNQSSMPPQSSSRRTPKEPQQQPQQQPQPQPQQQPQQQPHQQSHQQSQQQSQTPATQQRPTAGSPSSEEQLENMEVAARRAIARASRRTDEAEERALAAEARAEAAEARAVAAEARAVAADTVAAEARCAPSNADEIAAVRAAMRTAFERERHQLLRKLGDALASDAASRRQLHEYQRYRDGASAVAAPGGAVQATPAEATPAEAVATPEVPVLLVARRRSRVVAAGPTASPAEASATPEVPTQPVARRRSRVIRVT